jgi:HEPN domain-containing protein
MPQIDFPPRIEDLKNLISQLSQKDLLTLLADIQEQLQTFEMMSIAESGFQEWNDPEEEIYDADSAI